MPITFTVSQENAKLAPFVQILTIVEEFMKVTSYTAHSTRQKGCVNMLQFKSESIGMG